MKYLILVSAILLSIGCTKPPQVDMSAAHPELFAAYQEEEHPCLDLEVLSAHVYADVQLATRLDHLEVVINKLQRGVKTNPEFVVLQGAAYFLYETPEMSFEDFYKGVMHVCQKKFGPIADRKHV